MFWTKHFINKVKFHIGRSYTYQQNLQSLYPGISLKSLQHYLHKEKNMLYDVKILNITRSLLIIIIYLTLRMFPQELARLTIPMSELSKSISMVYQHLNTLKKTEINFIFLKHLHYLQLTLDDWKEVHIFQIKKKVTRDRVCVTQKFKLLIIGDSLYHPITQNLSS